MYGELGRYPMKVQRKINAIKYWIKILKLNETSPLKIIYQVLRDDADNDITYKNKNWAYQIKTILEELGFANLWIFQNELYINFSLIKLRILDTFKQSWYSYINNSPRLSSYCLYKHDFELEPYLKHLDINKFKIALTRFRLSAHSLNIETGRHHGIDRVHRKCMKCTMNVVESEMHFLLICPHYSDIRSKFIKPYFCRWPTIQKFERLMISNKTIEITNTAKFLFYAFKKRDSV